MIAAELSVVGGKHSGQIIPLNRRRFLIGREHDCQLRPNSERVSRHHCVFSLDDFSVRLKDLGSTNGTFVNGNRISKEIVLKNGDHVVIGNLEFQLSVLPGKVVDPSNSGEIDLRGRPDDTQVSSQTVMELPTTNAPGSDFEITTRSAPPATLPAVSEPAAAVPAAPSVAQTTVMNIPPAEAPTIAMAQPGMMPGMGYGQPMMPQMGFPGGMYGGYPYQHMMPGYAPMYPQMMPGMGYGMPQQMSPQGQPAPAATTTPQIEVSLPDPSSTGATDEPVKGSTGANPKDTQKPTGAADAILKQYSGGRRPSN